MDRDTDREISKRQTNFLKTIYKSAVLLPVTKTTMVQLYTVRNCWKLSPFG